MRQNLDVDQRSYPAQGTKEIAPRCFKINLREKIARFLKTPEANHWIYLEHGGLTVKGVMESTELWI